MKLLAIDTAANLCAACIFDGDAGRELGRAVRDIGKGHAEVLMDVIGEALAAANAAYADLDSIAVAVGPGSFTGIRVGVSVARGLALALKIPAVGVSTLEALAFEARQSLGAKPVLAAIDGGRDGIYAAIYDRFGKIVYAPAVVGLDTLAGLAGKAALLAGTAAARVAEQTSGKDLLVGPQATTADIAAYARLGLTKDFAGERPRPLYLRAPDARPQAHLALPRKP
jgi:tRNA threonylcarbamoyladenosine biosynthesis protein TsaB